MKTTSICTWCGTEFMSYNPNPKYCGVACKSEGLKIPIDAVELRLARERGLTQKSIATQFNTSSQVIGKALKRYRLPPCVQQRTGADSPGWKGTAAGYAAFHQRVRHQRGTPSECERCGVTNSSLRYEWANLTGHYEDTADYQRMCVACHRKYDAKRNIQRFCLRGHEFTPENTRYETPTKRKCLACCRIRDGLRGRR